MKNLEMKISYRMRMNFSRSVMQLEAPDEVKEKISKEIRRFRNSMNNPAESGVIRTYIETMLDMPWDHSV